MSRTMTIGPSILGKIKIDTAAKMPKVPKLELVGKIGGIRVYADPTCPRHVIWFGQQSVQVIFDAIDQS